MILLCHGWNQVFEYTIYSLGRLRVLLHYNFLSLEIDIFMRWSSTNFCPYNVQCLLFGGQQNFKCEKCVCSQDTCKTETHFHLGKTVEFVTIYSQSASHFLHCLSIADCRETGANSSPLGCKAGYTLDRAAIHYRATIHVPVYI